MIRNALKTIILTVSILCPIAYADTAQAAWDEYSPYNRFDIDSCDYRLRFSIYPVTQLRTMLSALRYGNEGSSLRFSANIADAMLFQRAGVLQTDEFAALKLLLEQADRNSEKAEFVAYDNQPSDGSLQLSILVTVAVDGRPRGEVLHVDTRRLNVVVQQLCS